MRWTIFLLVALISTASAEQAAAEPARDQYAAMKQAVLTSLSNSADVYDFTAARNGRRGSIDLYSCGGEASETGLTENDPLSQVAGRIAWTMMLDRTLQRAGLSDVVRSDLGEVEHLNLEHLRSELSMPRRTAESDPVDARLHALEARMAQKLNAAVKQRHTSGFARPAFEVDGGCGAGEVYYHLAPSDPAAQLRVLKQFYYMLCEIQGIDPLDEERCTGWMQGNGDLSGAGTYYYVARLPGGRMVKNTYTVTKAKTEAIMNKGAQTLPTLTIPLQLP